MLLHGDPHYLKKKIHTVLAVFWFSLLYRKCEWKFTVAAVLCRVQSHPSVTRRLSKHQLTWVRWKFKLHLFKLTWQFLCNGNLKPQPQANKKFTKKCCVTVVFTIETQIHVLNEKSILTNWNSVAAPAPASAFLSAPADEERKNEHGSNTQEMFITTGFVLIVYLRGAADRL